MSSILDMICFLFCVEREQVQLQPLFDENRGEMGRSFDTTGRMAAL